MTRQAIIAIGANIEPRRNLPAAVGHLTARGDLRVIRVSSAWRTPAIGSDGPEFLNAAALIETSLTPEQLKYDVLRPIERAMGRIRDGDANAPRPIDLDLVLFDDLRIARRHGSRTIVVPDPQIQDRAHLALPLAEIAPAWPLPGDGRTLADVAATAPDRSAARLESWPSWPPTLPLPQEVE